MNKTILITGCSSGIGYALASELHQRGATVFASARSEQALQPLARQGIQTLVLDVNDDDSIAAALAEVEQQAGVLDMLINNAGFSQVGAVVDLSRENLRRQYETNVISPVVLTRQALPLLQTAVARHGRAQVVNVGSIVGLFTTPFAGAYCSSKAAIHALSDAMRMELAPLGITVTTVQPGGVKSAFGNHAETGLQLPPDSPYLPVEAGVRARAQAGQQGAQPAEQFVQPVVSALLGEKPPAVVRGGTGSFKLVWLNRLLPLSVFDRVMAKRFGLNRLGNKP